MSGPYTKDGICLGFLIDNFGGERNHFDEEVIITRL